MAKMLRAAAALLLAALLASGCAATGGAAVAEMSRGKGVLLVRVSTQGLKYVTGFGIFIRPVGSQQQEGLLLNGWTVLHPQYWDLFYQDEAEKGSFVAVALEPGEYEINGLQAQASAWGGMRRATLDGPLARFHVEAGKATYVGNLHARFQGDTGRIPPHVRIRGYVIPTGTTRIAVGVELRDTRARDFAELQKVAPGLEREQVQVRLMR